VVGAGRPRTEVGSPGNGYAARSPTSATPNLPTPP
jgi:hypothetical protein